MVQWTRLIGTGVRASLGGGGAGLLPGGAGKLRFYAHKKNLGYAPSKILTSPISGQNTEKKYRFERGGGSGGTIINLPMVPMYLGLALTRVSVLFLTRRRELHGA